MDGSIVSRYYSRRVFEKPQLLEILERCKKAKVGDVIPISSFDYFVVEADGSMRIESVLGFEGVLGHG